MISRPQPARFFQLLCARDDLPRAMGVVASRFGLQLEAEADTEGAGRFPTLTPELTQRLDRYQELADRYRLYWPAEKSRPEMSVPPGGQALELLDQALAALEAWRLAADPIIQQYQASKGLATDLDLLFEMLTHLDESSLDFSAINHGADANSQRFLAARMFVIPELWQEELPLEPLTLSRTVVGEFNTFLVVVGVPSEIATLADWVASVRGRVLEVPAWCKGMVDELLPETLERMEQNCSQQARLWQELETIAKNHEVSRLLRVTEHLQWFFSVMAKSASNQYLARVEGWTDGEIHHSINHHFADSGIKALLDVKLSKSDDPPMLLVNPAWAKPFEIFPRLLGVPGHNEADPTPLLAFVAPLLFGFMFGDVGQGAVLVLAGIMLRKKFAAAWLLIAGGVSAIFFGIMFGSFFCREDLFSPLWLHPAQEPLTVLAVPLVLGFIMIIGGMLLNGLGEFWGGAGKTWLLKEGGMVVLYSGLVLGFLHQVGWSIAGVGLAWFLYGNYMVYNNIAKVAGRLGHLLEATMQLAVNTLSFARVGAFALAHAGLSMAVVTLAGLPEGVVPGLLIMIFGNILILALEGLVVSVQTTRLILFEFFVRFLRGSGRPFRPIPAPPIV